MTQKEIDPSLAGKTHFKFSLGEDVASRRKRLLSDLEKLEPRPTEQQIFDPKQVLSLDEITPGKKFIRRFLGRDGDGSTIIILEKPFANESGVWVEVNEIYNDDHARHGNLSLADAGVVAYKDGNWQTHNYLIDPEKPLPTEETN